MSTPADISITPNLQTVADDASMKASFKDGKFALTISICGKEKTSLFSMKRGIFIDNLMNEMLCRWIMNASKPLFFQPCKNIDLSPPEDCDPIYKECFSWASFILKHHNDEVMLKLVPLAGMAKDNKKVLMINVAENDRFKALYDEMHNVAPDNCFYMSFDNGWDPISRSWRIVEPVMYLPELLKKISDDKIKTIVTVNDYIPENYILQCGFHLPAVCFLLGVELVVFDSDNYDDIVAGQLRKLAWNCTTFRRFVFSKTTHADWNELFGIHNAHYVAVPNTKTKLKEFRLSPDLTAIVTSHCRIGMTAEALDIILFLFEEFDGTELSSSLHLCYLAIKKLLFLDPNLDIYNRMLVITKIQHIVFAAMQVLKYEAIETFEATGNMEIYGDAGWNVIFPEHYCGRYLASQEIDEKLFSGNYLPIIPGDIPHYFQGGGPITDLILKGLPYLCFPALVCSDELSVLKQLECATGLELKNKFSEIHSIMQDGSVMAAMERIAGILFANMKHTARRLAISESGDEPEWNRLLDMHYELLNKKVDNFISERTKNIDRVLKIICCNENAAAASSKYEQRTYVKRIRQWKATVARCQS